MIEHRTQWEPSEHKSIRIEADERGHAPHNGIVISDTEAFSATFQEAHTFIVSPEGVEMYREVDQISLESLRKLVHSQDY